MLYYRYELRWKAYESLKALEKGQESEFDEKYSDDVLQHLNECLYNEYYKNQEYILVITDKTKAEIEICLAFSLGFSGQEIYEQTILAMFADCEILRKEEITIEIFKGEIGVNRYAHHPNRLLDSLGIDWHASRWEPLPFDLEEQVLEVRSLNRADCEKRAKEILGSASLYEEIDRIYSAENVKRYYGHPVHYMISAGDWMAAEHICELLIRSLTENKRLISNRVAAIRNITKGAYKDDRLKQVIRAAEGGVLIIGLNSEDSMGRFATDFHELTKVIGEALEEGKKDTLFIFVEIMLKDHDAMNHILTKADVIQIREGTGTLEEAKSYLMELVNEAEYDIEDKTDVINYLPECESYSVTDIFKAYYTWYGSGLKNHVYKAYKTQKSYRMKAVKEESKPYEELQAMIGLSEVKAVVDQIIASSKVLRVRERMGMNTDGTSLHMLFSGNPGTAKTTVARLLAKILKEEDAIKSGRFVECGRQDLVGKYVGWTARIVEEKFKEAMGGVLFIDEAYALVDDSNTFGAEAINAITQMMENYRNDIIVIFAGYPDKMQDFLAQNEGLKSRIAFHLDFPDYSSGELLEILKLMSRKRDYVIEEEALSLCRQIFGQATSEDNFGNGRYARNVLEQAILMQSGRIVNECIDADISKEEICSLKAADFAIPGDDKKKPKRRIGFCS